MTSYEWTRQINHPVDIAITYGWRNALGFYFRLEDPHLTELLSGPALIDNSELRTATLGNGTYFNAFTGPAGAGHRISPTAMIVLWEKYGVHQQDNNRIKVTVPEPTGV